MSSTKKNAYGVRRFDLSEERSNKRIPVDVDHLAVLESADTAEIRLGDANSSAIPTRNLESIEIPDHIENIYLSNDAGTGELVLLLGVQGVQSSVGSPEIEGTIDISDREAREIGKARVQNSSGVLIDPATDDSITSELSREIGTWSAGTLPIQESTPLDVSGATVPVEGDLSIETPEIVTDSTTLDGEAEAAQIQLGNDRAAFDVHYDLSAEATITVEVSNDATNWRAFRSITDIGPATLTENTAYEYVRAYSTNVNLIEITGKGA